MEQLHLFLIPSNVILRFWTSHIGHELKKKNAWIIIDLPIQTLRGVQIRKKYPTIISVWGRTLQKESHRKRTWWNCHANVYKFLTTVGEMLSKNSHKAIKSIGGRGRFWIQISMVQTPELPLPSSLLNNPFVS